MSENEDISRALKILVVDDIPSARKVLGRMLKTLGFENLVEVSTVNEAVEKLATDPIELVITDIHLKDGLGIDILARLKEENAASSVPFIFVTSDMEKVTFKKAIELGANSYLLKPFSQSNLILKMKECLGKASNTPLTD